jgi:hypothetical protein
MAWDESKHPRVKNGNVNGGQFTSKGVAVATKAAKEGANAKGKGPSNADGGKVFKDMSASEKAEKLWDDIWEFGPSREDFDDTDDGFVSWGDAVQSFCDDYLAEAYGVKKIPNGLLQDFFDRAYDELATEEE